MPGSHLESANMVFVSQASLQVLGAGVTGGHRHAQLCICFLDTYLSGNRGTMTLCAPCRCDRDSKENSPLPSFPSETGYLGSNTGQIY